MSARVHVESAFVTTQSKVLEKKRLVRQTPSPSHARLLPHAEFDPGVKDIANKVETLRSR